MAVKNILKILIYSIGQNLGVLTTRGQDGINAMYGTSAQRGFQGIILPHTRNIW